jgi:[ribosomal protein S18]-alanine N-acetyltransferase
MLYRLYTPADFSQLYSVEELCFQPPFRFGRRYMRQILAHRNTAAWVAEDNSQVAGFAIVQWNRWEEEIRAYIQTIEVSPEQRSIGIGGEILRCIESSAHKAGATSIWLHVDSENLKAIHFYENCGYLLLGKEDNYYPQDRAALVYGKLL